jgi:ankyrin repeat protein
MTRLLNELPEELVLRIFSYLPDSDLLSARHVSRFFYRIANDNLLWKNHVKKYFPHYLPPLVKAEIDYKKIFYNAMKSDYQGTHWISEWESICQPFNIEEVKLFNAAKLNALDLFSKSLAAYDTPKKLESLLCLTDKTHRSLFHWAGYFANQSILNCIFTKIKGLFTVHNTINGLTYYQYAVLCNQIDIIKQLRNDELRTLNQGDKPITALAIDCCHLDLTRYLFEERGLELTQVTNEGHKSFQYAAAHGNSEILKYVLSKCHVTEDGTFILYTASISCNNAITMQLLLKENYAVPAQGSIPLALDQKSPVLTIMLLANLGCNAHIALNKKIDNNFYTFSPEMNLALAERLFESVKQYYLDDNNNYDTAKKDQFGNSIFHWLAFCNQVEILSSLAGTLANEKNSNDLTPTYLAAICGHLNIVKIYLASGFDVNTPGTYQTTLLHTAAYHGHTELVRSLTTYPQIDLNARNDHNSTPLRTACAEGHADIVAILLGAGADVNLPNLHGVTPLIAAAENGNANILELLLAHPDINVNSKVINGCTALDYARQNGHQGCIRLLKAHQNSHNCLVM